MPRPLKGPVTIGSSPVFFARLTVRPQDRAQAGTTRLTKSLQTTDKEEAFRRWPEAMDQLRRELDRRMGKPATVEEVQERLESGYGSDASALDHIPRWFGTDPANLNATDEQRQAAWTPEFEAAKVLGVNDLDPYTNQLHAQVLEAVESGTKLITWEDVLTNYKKVQKKKRGRPVADSTLVIAKGAIRWFSNHCPYPSAISKASIKAMIKDLEDRGHKPTSIHTKCNMLQSMVNVGIKSDLLDIKVNPFTLVDFQATAQEDEEKRAFELKTELPKLLAGEHGEVFRLLVGSSLRIGELANRDLEKDLDGNMLIIRENKANNWKPKTKSSYRRVPLDDKAVEALKTFYAHGWRPRTMGDKLNAVIRKTFNCDPLLTVHSTRHTFKTIARLVQVPADISDEISGHAKATVSKTSDQYGHYPDEALQMENQKCWDWLDALR